MDHADHVRLIRGGIDRPGGAWADLGSGTGAFTLALADVLGSNSEIYSVDREASPLAEQERAMRRRFPTTRVQYLVADFAHPLDLPSLDGIVMANSLHFVENKLPTLTRVHGYLRPGGRLILVEYNVDRGNRWVPYPLSYRTWARLAADVGFADTRFLAAVPSYFLNEIYSALSFASDARAETADYD